MPLTLAEARQNVVDQLVNGDDDTIAPSLLQTLLTDIFEALDNSLQPFSKYDADAAPTVNDDGANTSGNGSFVQGSLWFDQVADEGYILTDATTGAAQWLKLTFDASELGTAANENVGSGDGDVLQLNGSGQIPAYDGSQLTNMPGGGDMYAADNLVELTDVSAARDNLGLGDLAVLDTVGAAQFDAGAVTNAKIVAASVTTDKLSSSVKGLSVAHYKFIKLRMAQIEGLLSEYDDGFADDYSDETYIDTAASSNQTFTAGKYAPTVVATPLDLISEPVIADAAPDAASVGILIDVLSGSPVLNTDIIVSASRDDGVTWETGALTEIAAYADGTKILVADGIDLSGQTSDTDMRYRIQTANSADVEFLATDFNWE